VPEPAPDDPGTRPILPRVSDLPFVPAHPELSGRLIAAVDADGKIQRALSRLGCCEGADVTVLGEAPARVAALRDGGARVTVAALPDGHDPAPDADVAATLAGLVPASADVLVALWSAFAGPSPASLALVDRILRPGGRLLALQDYGRDDLDGLRGAERTTQLLEWSRRDGWYLGAGFRIHVIHAYWSAADVTEAGDLLEAAFGAAGRDASRELRRPRVAHNIAVYHRSAPPA
jgi:hypothetical protein